MAGRKKQPKTLREELQEILNEENHRRQMLYALVEKAISGDMKAFEAVREILNEGAEKTTAGVVVRMENGVEELAR